MKALKYGALAVVGTFALAILVGFFLPSRWDVRRETTIRSSPDAIHAHVARLDRWPEWMPWILEDPAMQITFEGASGSVGSIMRWKSAKLGDGSLKLARTEAAKGMWYELVMDEFEAPARGSITFEPDAAGTRVVWADTGDVGGNPVMKACLPILLEPMLARHFALGLERLKAIVETKG